MSLTPSPLLSSSTTSSHKRKRGHQNGGQRKSKTTEDLKYDQLSFIGEEQGDSLARLPQPLNDLVEKVQNKSLEQNVPRKECHKSSRPLYDDVKHHSARKEHQQQPRNHSNDDHVESPPKSQSSAYWGITTFSAMKGVVRAVTGRLSFGTCRAPESTDRKLSWSSNNEETPHPPSQTASAATSGKSIVDLCDDSDDAEGVKSVENQPPSPAISSVAFVNSTSTFSSLSSTKASILAGVSTTSSYSPSSSTNADNIVTGDSTPHGATARGLAPTSAKPARSDGSESTITIPSTPSPRRTNPWEDSKVDCDSSNEKRPVIGSRFNRLKKKSSEDDEWLFKRAKHDSVCIGRQRSARLAGVSTTSSYSPSSSTNAANILVGVLNQRGATGRGLAPTSAKPARSAGSESTITIPSTPSPRRTNPWEDSKVDCDSSNKKRPVIGSRFNRLKKKSSEDDEWLFEHAKPDSVCIGGQRSARLSSASLGLIKIGRQRSARLSGASLGLIKMGEETIEIPDSDEDEKLELSPIVFDVTRIAVGKKIFTSGCQIRFEHKGFKLHYNPPKPSENSGPIMVDFDSLTELKYFMAEDNIAVSDLDESAASLGDSFNGQSRDDGGDDEISFLAMRVTPTESNGLKYFSNAYCQEGSHANVDERKRYIVVEFKSDKDFAALIKAMSDTPLSTFVTSASRLARSEAVSYSQTLQENNEKDKQKRLSSICGSTSKRHDGFLGNRQGKDILLVYPFPVRPSDVREAVKDLTELKVFGGNITESTDSPNEKEEEEKDVYNGDDNVNPSSLDATANQSSKTSENRGRAHYVTIVVDDYCRLEAPEFFNDSLIDFWMQWMQRSERRSTVHVFTTHFYTTLAEEGAHAVESWTAKRDVDIFEKKFIFVPVNKSLHWSLCVVVNPGAIFEDQDSMMPSDKCPCFVFLDSLKAHRKNEIASNIRLWLNSEWTRLNKDNRITFTAKNMPVYDPRIPYQDNCWDCGVFVCRYAFAMYQLRERTFSFREMENGNVCFMTESDVFQFGMDDIHRIRSELRTLLERLSVLYTMWKTAKYVCTM